MLDDNDILSSVKEWQFHPDKVLSALAKNLLNRKLFRTNLSDKPVSEKWKEKMLEKITDEITGDPHLSPYFLITGNITNSAYDSHSG